MTAPTDERACPHCGKVVNWLCHGIAQPALTDERILDIARQYSQGSPPFILRPDEVIAIVRAALSAQPVGAVQPMTEPTPEAAEAFFAALGSDHPLSTLRDEMVAAGGGAVQLIRFKRSGPSPNAPGWVTFNVRTEDADRAEAALAAPPSSTPEPLTDTQRLDRLEAMWCDGVHVEVCGKGEGLTWHAVRKAASVFVGSETFTGNSLREAIDRALTDPWPMR